MKICLAQIKPIKGDVTQNIQLHVAYVHQAISLGADLIVFPELSLTGYEPALAKELAFVQGESNLNEFQCLSDRNEIVISLGVPTKSDTGIRISMIVFQPKKEREVYSKQLLHEDELPYFEAGTEEKIFKLGEFTLAPAICYEALQPQHISGMRTKGAEIYLASVAKSQRGIEKAFDYFPKMASQFSMPILMCNSVGFCDNFESAGQSSIWDENGRLISSLNERDEGLLVYDLETRKVSSHLFFN